MSLKQAGHANKPFVLELVGLAGAGKTTLASALEEKDRRFRVAPDIQLRKLGHSITFFSRSFALLPVILQANRRSRNFNWDEIKALAYLEAWPSVLTSNVDRKNTLTVLDHGPIFKLATLHAFGPESLKTETAARWWRKIVSRWAVALDMVVLLSAPLNILVERINRRNQRHAVKGKREQEAYVFLQRYQASYEYVLSQFSSFNQMEILRYDTEHISIHQMLEEILDRFN